MSQDAAQKKPTTVALRARIDSGAKQHGKRERVEVPELGEGVAIEFRSMSFGERAQLLQRGFHESNADQPIADTFQPLLLIFTAHDPESGERLFEDTPEDLDFVRSLPPAVIDRLSPIASRVSGLMKEDAKAIAQGSEAVASDSSSSPSPARSAA